MATAQETTLDRTVYDNHVTELCAGRELMQISTLGHKVGCPACIGRQFLPRHACQDNANQLLLVVCDELNGGDRIAIPSAPKREVRTERRIADASTESSSLPNCQLIKR